MNGLNSNDRELLARLIERFNQIESNAKRIDELPAVSSLVGDSKLHVSVNGTSYSMTVQELLSAIESRKYDHITFINDLEINGNILTADSAGWVIQDVVYNLTNPFEETIPYASAGYQRTDLLIANTNNEFLVIQGDENEGISFAPPLPPNTVLVTTLDVNDNTINSSPNPIGSDNFKIKNESNFIKATGTHAADFIEQFWLNTEASHIVLESIAEIKSLVFREGFKAYPGKQIFITNNGPNNLKIKANHSSNVKFNFPSGQDYTAKPKETVVFYLSDDLSEVCFLSTNNNSNSNLKVLILDNNIDRSLNTTGVSGSLLLKAYTIPANTIKSDSIIEATLFYSKSGVTTSASVTIAMSNTPNYSGHTLLLGTQFAAANRSIKIHRDTPLHTGNYYNNISGSGTNTNDYNAYPNEMSVYPINVNEVIYISLYLTVTNPVDTITLENFTVRNIFK